MNLKNEQKGKGMAGKFGTVGANASAYKLSVGKLAIFRIGGLRIYTAKSSTKQKIITTTQNGSQKIKLNPKEASKVNIIRPLMI
ncbi:hypothetical protein AMQ83_23500, partial [Paenibacillus riograndensis]